MAFISGSDESTKTKLMCIWILAQWTRKCAKRYNNWFYIAPYHCPEPTSSPPTPLEGIQGVLPATSLGMQQFVSCSCADVTIFPFRCETLDWACPTMRAVLICISLFLAMRSPTSKYPLTKWKSFRYWKVMHGSDLN